MSRPLACPEDQQGEIVRKGDSLGEVCCRSEDLLDQTICRGSAAWPDGLREAALAEGLALGIRRFSHAVGVEYQAVSSLKLDLLDSDGMSLCQADGGPGRMQPKLCLPV